ncbi:RagB/SusD family nutrient uptake outer membrane protein [Parapedobacter tibetensis]|uniref:RagB/SusD family nutrient uptake outer membrane protein n=1 Tax=Parapedobacter tibetensis TaxID=2972951 RepID=UPI00214DDD64|nr:RagB/SusD family nutrient uptake outer membrane protein [Parapedobacter tibetensis]
MNRFKYITLMVVLLVCGCNDSFLDRYPLDTATHATYWKTEYQLKAALYPCYEGLRYDLIMNPNIFGNDVVWGALSSGLVSIPGGRHTALDGFPFTSIWGYCYQNIFVCNNFLDHYDAAEIDQDIKDAYAAEVRVIRALQYFWLTSYWGDVPLVTEVINSSEAYGPRNPRSEVIQFVLDDLDWAASKLGPDIATGENVGRINRWGALAVKARIALQNELWEVAAATAKEIMDNSPHALYPDYGALYHLEGNAEVNPGNREAIIYSLYVDDIRMHNMTNYTCTGVDYIRINPSKRLVDAFLCTDGKPAKTGLEYYDRTDVEVSDLYTYPEQHYSDYFTERDPRMSMTLYTPGDEWPGRDDGDADVDVTNPVFQLPRFAVLQNNNRLGANGLTGFYFKKYNTPELAGATNRDHNNLNVIRYAEILLIYAEALFNIQGETLTQAQIDMTVNQLRARVDMHPMLLTELDAWGMDLKTELHRERRVELSMDGMRYFDILRWREGEIMLGKAMVGPSLTVCLNDLGASPFPGNGVDEFGDIIYQKSVAEGGLDHFDPNKHYLWPVPNAEREKNPALGQNPGW